MRPIRESQLIANLKEKNNKEFPEKSLESIWRNIINVCTQLQSPLKVLVPESLAGRFAVTSYFGASADVEAHLNTKAIIEQLRQNPLQVAIMPMTELEPNLSELKQLVEKGCYIFAKIPPGSSTDQGYVALAKINPDDLIKPTCLYAHQAELIIDDQQTKPPGLFLGSYDA